MAGLYQPGVPIGTVIQSACNSAPVGYIYCNGASLSRAQYPGLFAAIGTAYGTADGNSFNLPDMRGFFARGVDDTGNVDSDRGARIALNTGGNTGANIGSRQLDALRTHDHNVAVHNGSGGSSNYNNNYNTSAAAIATYEPSQGVISGGQNYSNWETRPHNVYFKFYIKAF